LACFRRCIAIGRGHSGGGPSGNLVEAPPPLDPHPRAGGTLGPNPHSLVSIPGVSAVGQCLVILSNVFIDKFNCDGGRVCLTTPGRGWDRLAPSAWLLARSSQLDFGVCEKSRISEVTESPLAPKHKTVQSRGGGWRHEVVRPFCQTARAYEGPTEGHNRKSQREAHPYEK